jgi:predicted DNA-binding transcriptional regulator AlpA
LLLAPRQAAQALSICEKTLWSLTAPRGSIPAVRIGRAVRYDLADLQAFIDASKKREVTP